MHLCMMHLKDSSFVMNMGHVYNAVSCVEKKSYHDLGSRRTSRITEPGDLASKDGRADKIFGNASLPTVWNNQVPVSLRS